MKFIELHLDSNDTKIAINPLNIMTIVKLSKGTKIYFTSESSTACVKEDYYKVLMMINDTMDK